MATRTVGVGAVSAGVLCNAAPGCAQAESVSSMMHRERFISAAVANPI